MTVQRTVRKPLIALALTTLVAIGIFQLLLGYAGVSVKPADTYDVSAVVPNAVRLIDHADVRQAGVKIGQVKAIDPHGRHTLLRLSIDRRYGPVYDNARILIRGKSLAAENYVDLDPGAPPGKELAEGRTLPISRAPESTQLDQIIEVMKPERVRDLRRIVQALGTGLESRGGTLNQFLRANATATTDGYEVIQAFADERVALANLVRDYALIADTLGQRGEDLRTFVRGTTRLSREFARHEQSANELLVTAPPFIRTSRESIRRLTRLSGVATPVLTDTRIALERLVPMVDRLDEASTGAHDAIRALGPFNRRTEPLLATLERFSPTARRFLRPLEGNLRELNPLAAYMKPYARDSAVALALIAATAKSHDRTGHTWRIIPLTSMAALGGTLSEEQLEALEALVRSGTVLKHTGSRGKNPHPPPGPLKELKSFEGLYPRVEADRPYASR